MMPAGECRGQYFPGEICPAGRFRSRPAPVQPAGGQGGDADRVEGAVAPHHAGGGVGETVAQDQELTCNFLKKHYEKILLGLVLAGLIGVLVFMLFYIAADRDVDGSDKTSKGLIFNPPAKALPESGPDLHQATRR
jgi:hypothetical protein